MYLIFIISASTFFVLAAHDESENMSDSALFCDSLEDVCNNQPDLTNLMENRRFISLGYRFTKKMLRFGKNQELSFVKWLTSDNQMKRNQRIP